MSRIHLNFAKTPQPAGISRWLLLLAGIAALGATLGWQHWIWQPQQAAAEQRLHALQLALKARQPATLKIADAQLAAEWNRAISVAGELNLPWEKLFAIFEREGDVHVGILSLEPDVVKGELVLTAEAKNFAEMLTYYRMLQAQDNLSTVVLHTHQVNQLDREKPIRFRVTAKWGTRS